MRRKLSFAELWLSQGGGGNEVDIEDKKAMTVTWDGLVSYLEAYEGYLKEKECKINEPKGYLEWHAWAEKKSKKFKQKKCKKCLLWHLWERKK